MMKNGLFLLLCTMFVAACGSKGGDSGNNSSGTVATTALDACFNGTAPQGANCSSINYGAYSQYGFYTYGTNGLQTQHWQNNGYYNYSRSRWGSQTYGVGNYAAFCACRQGTRPVLVPQGGMGCVSSAYIPGNAVYYGMNSSNQFVLTAQFANYNGYNYSGRSCYQGVINACRIGSGDCGTTATCNATVTGSPIGVCVGNVQQQSGYNRGGRGYDRNHNGRDDRYERGNQYGGYSQTGSISGGGIR